MFRKVICYFFRFLITVLLKDIFYRLKMLLEGSQHFRFLQSAGVKSKHGFYLANSGVTLILLFFLLSSFFAIFPLQIHGCNTEAFPQPLFYSLDLQLGSDLPHWLMFFFTCLFALQLFGLPWRAKPTHSRPLAQYPRTRGVYPCGAPLRLCSSSFPISLLFHSPTPKHAINFLYSGVWLWK